MSFFVTKYPAGTFSWADITSKDITKSKSFFASLFGWTSKDEPTGEGRPDYTMFYLEGKVVAGGMPAFNPQMPSVWNSYVTVENLDEAIKKAEGLGAKIVMPAMDVLESGRMATIQDPTEAFISLWEPKNHIGAQVVNTTGAMGWNELYVHDLEKAKQFYADLFGWKYDVDPKSGYAMIKNNERANGGMLEITPEMQGMVPCWMVYFTVKSMDESLDRVKENEGKVMMGPREIPQGKIAGIMDPSGAPFVIIENSGANPLDEWKE
jgi:predicted enzyme related to lactoylglutathione lyase